MFDETCLEEEPLGCSTPIPLRVLVIDDDSAQVEVLFYRFRKLGYAVSTASSAREGMAMARLQRPDVILLDIRLPDGDGLDVCQQLADDPETCGIPVIIVSGMERPDIIRATRAAGCRFFMRKPYDPNALLILVEAAMAEEQTW